MVAVGAISVVSRAVVVSLAVGAGGLVAVSVGHVVFEYGVSMGVDPDD